MLLHLVKVKLIQLAHVSRRGILQIVRPNIDAAFAKSNAHGRLQFQIGCQVGPLIRPAFLKGAFSPLKIYRIWGRVMTAGIPGRKRVEFTLLPWLLKSQESAHRPHPEVLHPFQSLDRSQARPQTALRMQRLGWPFQLRYNPIFKNSYVPLES